MPGIEKGVSAICASQDIAKSPRATTLHIASEQVPVSVLLLGLFGV